MENEFMTAFERERANRHKAICAEYVELTAKHTGIKPNRIIKSIAEKHSMTIPGVKRILIDNGLYVTKKRES